MAGSSKSLSWLDEEPELAESWKLGRSSFALRQRLWRRLEYLVCERLGRVGAREGRKVDPHERGVFWGVRKLKLA